MECDVIQDCTLDVDPLATVEQCVDIDGNITSIYQDSMNDRISDSNESIHLPESSTTSSATDVASTTSEHIYANLISETNNSGGSLSNITIIKSGEINYHYYPHHSNASKVRSKVLKRHHQTLRKTPPRIIVKQPTLLSTASRSPQAKQHSMAAHAGKSEFRAPNVSRSSADMTDSPSKLTTSIQASIKSSVGMGTSLRKLSTATTSNALQHGPASTMREVLASIPGFSIKTRRRGNKKMSTAAQIEQTREGCIDLETPDSILVSTNLRDLLNKETFCLLPPLYQYKLVQLLPSVDRPAIEQDAETIRLNSSSLANEFFARACLEWRERLAEGEFTPENQLKLRSEAEKEKIKLDPWKLKHFEPIWGEKIRLKRNSRFVSPQLLSTSSSGANATSTPSTSKQINLVSKSSSSTSHSSIGSSQSQLPCSFASGKHSTAAAVLAATTVTTSLSSFRESSTALRKSNLGNRKLMLSDRPSLKTTIKLRPTTSIATSTIPLTPHNYTTSSGRIVKSPNNVYASGSASAMQHKRTRTGAVTRSSLATTSSSSTNSASPELNNQMKVSIATRSRQLNVYFSAHSDSKADVISVRLFIVQYKETKKWKKKTDIRCL